MPHGNGQEKSLSWRAHSPVVKRGQMDEGMVPFSWLLQRSLQQWEHEDKTTQREGGKDGVRFTGSKRGREAAHTGQSCS